jgi:NAD-dependent deacetylase
MDAHTTSVIEEAATALRRSRYTVALTGAGLSAESGVPTYRGSGGVWTRFGEPTIDGWELFTRDPAAWWAEALDPRHRETEFARALEAAKPNAGHLAMAALEAAGYLQHVITQNIDNLHQAAGQRSLTEIHGNRAMARCMACGRRVPLRDVPLGRLPPACGVCGGVLKNDTVMFGEPIPSDALDACYLHASRAEAFLVVGTSAVVYPAADFPVQAKRRDATLIEVNPEETALSALADVVIRAAAGEALPALAALLTAEDTRWPGGEGRT